MKNPIVDAKRQLAHTAALQPSLSTGHLGEDKVSTEPGDPHFATGHLLADLKGRIISSGFVTTLAQAALFVLNFGSIVILARILTPQDFGLVAMVTTVTGFLRIFNDAGLSTATVQREGITHAQVSNLFWINVAVGGLMSLIIAVSAPAIAWFYKEPRLVNITLALAGTFILTGTTVQQMALLNRQMRFKIIALIQIASMAVATMVAIGMAWLGCRYWSLVGSQLSLPVAALVMTWSVSRWRPQLPRRRSGTWPLLSFGVNVTASGFMYSLAKGTDGLLIGRFYGSDSVGLYSRAMALLTRPLEQFLAPINAVFVPALSRLQAQPERYRRIFLQIFEIIALAGFIFTGLLLPLAHPLTLVVLGAKWERAAAILAGFTISALFLPLCSASSWLFASQGRGRDWVITSSIVSGITVCSFVAGLPFGPAGVAIAYSTSGVLILLPVMFYIAGQRGPVRTKDLWIGFLRHLPVGVVVYAATYLTCNKIRTFAPLAEMLISVAVGLLVGAAVICALTPTRRVVLGLLNALRELRISRSFPSSAE
jgi:O-antigen/teichoic acid export membrane protein